MYSMATGYFGDAFKKWWKLNQLNIEWSGMMKVDSNVNSAPAETFSQVNPYTMLTFELSGVAKIDFYH